jgi:2-methylcitrate dehydratase
MVVTENADFSRDYLDPDKRAIGNSVQVLFQDGSRTERVAVDYPIGHRRRRAEGIPELEAKFERNLATLFGARQCAAIVAACVDQVQLEALPVADFMALWVPQR